MIRSDRSIGRVCEVKSLCKTQVRLTRHIIAWYGPHSCLNYYWVWLVDPDLFMVWRDFWEHVSNRIVYQCCNICVPLQSVKLVWGMRDFLHIKRSLTFLFMCSCRILILRYIIFSIYDFILMLSLYLSKIPCYSETKIKKSFFYDIISAIFGYLTFLVSSTLSLIIRHTYHGCWWWAIKVYKRLWRSCALGNMQDTLVRTLFRVATDAFAIVYSLSILELLTQYCLALVYFNSSSICYYLYVYSWTFFAIIFWMLGIIFIDLYSQSSIVNLMLNSLS